jgi:hypothetical protein
MEDDHDQNTSHSRHGRIVKPSVRLRDHPARAAGPLRAMKHELFDFGGRPHPSPRTGGGCDLQHRASSAGGDDGGCNSTGSRKRGRGGEDADMHDVSEERSDPDQHPTVGADGGCWEGSGEEGGDMEGEEDDGGSGALLGLATAATPACGGALQLARACSRTATPPRDGAAAAAPAEGPDAVVTRCRRMANGERLAVTISLGGVSYTGLVQGLVLAPGLEGGAPAAAVLSAQPLACVPEEAQPAC